MKKTRKSVIAEFIEILQNIDKPISRLRSHPHFDETHDLIVGYTTIENGLPKAVYHCRHCNTTWKENSNYAYTTRKCPTCEIDTVYVNRWTSRRYDRLYVEETPNGFLAIDYHASVHFPDENTPWYKSTPEMRLAINRVFLFDREIGILMGDAGRREVAANTAKTKKYINALLYTACDGRGVTNERWGHLKEEARKTLRAQEAVLQEKAAARKAPVDIRANYQASPLDHEKLYKTKELFMAAVYNKTEHGTVYRVWCTACGKYHDVLDTRYVKKCPHCGMRAPRHDYEDDYEDYSVVGYNKVTCTQILMENTTLPENDLLLRLIQMYYEIDEDAEKNELVLKKRIVETQRIFLGKKLYVYGNGVRGDIRTKYNVAKVEGHFTYQPEQAMQSNDELREIVANSCMARSGLAESWGLVKGYQELYPFPSIKYPLGWYKDSRLELLAKANIPEIARHCCYHTDELHEGETLYDMLRIPKPVFKVVQQHNLTFGQMRTFCRLYSEDPSMTYEKYTAITGYNLDISRMIYLKTNFNLSFDKIMSYLNSVYDHQCIVRKDALIEWYDYLNMAQRLSMDLSQKSLMFPMSLKKEHDIAVFAFNALKQEVDAMQFAETAAKNKEKYEYSRGEFMVVIPQTPEDIIEEATKQHNCLRSYIERVRDGRTTVAFIRRKSAPKDSYISVEIFDERLVQVKAAFNRDPHNSKLDEFILHWCKACNINPNAY